MEDEEVFEAHEKAQQDMAQVRERFEMYNNYILKDQGTFYRWKEWRDARNRRRQQVDE